MRRGVGTAALCVAPGVASAQTIGEAALPYGFAALACVAAAGFGAWAMSLRSALKAGGGGRPHAPAALLGTLADNGDAAAIFDEGRLALSFGFDSAEPTPEGLAAAIADASETERLATAIQRLIAHGEGFGFWLSAASPARWAQGRVVGGRAVMCVQSAEATHAELESLSKQLHAAQQARDELAGALRAAPLLLWRRGAGGAVQWCNDLYLKACEFDDAAPTAQMPDLFPPKRSARTQSERRTAAVNGARRVFEIRQVATPDGGGYGMALDVTEQAEREEAARRTAETQAQTLDQLRLGVAIFDRNLRLTFCNDAAARLFAQDREWLDSGPELRELLDAMREKRRIPEVMEYAQWRAQTLEAARTLAEPQDYEWHLPDGVAVHVAARPHAEGGVMLVFEDISHVYSLQRRFRTATAVQQAALMKLAEGVVVFGEDGALKVFNPAFAEMWNLRADSQEGLCAADLARRCTPLFDDAAFWARLVAHVGGASASRRSWSCPLHRSDDSVLDMASTPLPDGGVMFAFADVTDSYLKEKTLRERNDALESASRLKSDFLNGIHNISYELNTPLNTIVGFSDILGQEMYGALNARQHEYVDAINIASSELRSFIGDIVDLAKLEADGMQFSIEDVDVYNTLRNVLRYVEVSAKENGLSLRFSCARSIGTIPADAPRLKQIAYNMAASVVRSTMGPGVLELSAERDAAHVDIRLSLIGRPLSDALMPVFEPAADGLPAQHRTGELRAATLGLTVVRRVVERHGGSVFVEPLPEGPGATIVCRMPVDHVRVHMAVEATA